MRTVLLSIVVASLLASVAVAADSRKAPPCCDQTPDCCSRCGVRMVCKVVCEMKTVKKSCWVVECEDFCVPMPRCTLGCKTGCGKKSCGGCGDSCCGDSCDSTGRPMVPPKCGKVRTRKKLVKKEIACKVPVYKCVVVCPGDCCGDGCVEDCYGAEEDAELPEGPGPANNTTRAAPLPPLLKSS